MYYFVSRAAIVCSCRHNPEQHLLATSTLNTACAQQSGWHVRKFMFLDTFKKSFKHVPEVHLRRPKTSPNLYSAVWGGFEAHLSELCLGPQHGVKCRWGCSSGMCTCASGERLKRILIVDWFREFAILSVFVYWHEQRRVFSRCCGAAPACFFVCDVAVLTVLRSQFFFYIRINAMIIKHHMSSDLLFACERFCFGLIAISGRRPWRRPLASSRACVFFT